MQDKPSPHSHWRHYKSTGGTDHTYEVLGISWHSETNEPLVIYRPLYEVPPESRAYGYGTFARPLALWFDIVEHVGKQVQRFTQI